MYWRNISEVTLIRINDKGFPGGAVVENLPANAGNMGSSPGPGRSACHAATKPVCHNYGACALEPTSHNY